MAGHGHRPHSNRRRQDDDLVSWPGQVDEGRVRRPRAAQDGERVADGGRPRHKVVFEVRTCT